MNQFAFEVYYEYQLSATSLNTPKSPDEIDNALLAFHHDLSRYLSDQDAAISTDSMKKTANSIFVMIQTTESEAQVKKDIEQCLSAFGLFGKQA